MKKKYVTTVLLMMLVAALSVGATLAYLTAKTETVTNSFTSGAVEIALTETPNTDSNDLDTEPDIWQAQMIPGKTYSKDPKVEVLRTTNVDCYLFVKFEEIGNPETYLDYTSTLTTANGWTQGDGTQIPANVWYRTVEKDADVKSWALLSGNTITVKDSVTKDNMAAASQSQLVYTAYATQKDELTVQQAWAQLNGN